MLKTWYYNFKIDSYYTINSYLDTFRNLPVIRDLVGENIYGIRFFKIIGFILGFLVTILNKLFIKLMYFGIIYSISLNIPGNHVNHFLYIYIVLSVLGMFINNATILNISVRKYLSLIIFRMDSYNYTKYSLVNGVLLNTIFNFIAFLILNIGLKLDIKIILVLLLINIFLKIIGEAINLYYYDKNHIPWYADVRKYFSLVVFFFIIALTSYFFTISNLFIYVFCIVSFIFFIFSLIYLLRYKNYRVIYKILNAYERVMNSSNRDNFSRAEMVKIKEKDKIIDNKRIVNKHGYDLFNTIFFLRHRDILYRSLNIYNMVACLVFVLLIIYIVINHSFGVTLSEYLIKYIGYIPMLMFFTNRASIMTQAMFFNSDHAMLRYNFFREKEVILGLFKRRLISLIKSNLSIGIIIGIGVSLLLIISGINNYLLIGSYFIYILVCNLFFSVHYLVLYYLLQPYNKDRSNSNFEYSLTIFLTYFLIFSISGLTINPILLSVSVIVLTIVYIIISLILVYKLAPKTFKLKN
ncbi:MAG: hypothetical protein IJL76_01065 [Bacilli bacterium]|nr:hypothetical protein [Bacilli bacterium]